MTKYRLTGAGGDSDSSVLCGSPWDWKQELSTCSYSGTVESVYSTYVCHMWQFTSSLSTLVMLSWGDRENQYCVVYMIGVSLILVSQGMVVLCPVSLHACQLMHINSDCEVKEYSTMFYVFYPFLFNKTLWRFR